MKVSIIITAALLITLLVSGCGGTDYICANFNRKQEMKIRECRAMGGKPVLRAHSTDCSNFYLERCLLQ